MTETNTKGFPRHIVIAVDGPAAAGKGTLSRRLAEHYRLRHLDTGLTYRATAKALAERGLPLDDEAVAAGVAGGLDLSGLDRSVLSAHEIGEAASKVAVMPEVRKALVTAQRGFAAMPPGAVLDGRDIGTVVCPDALVKFYVTASPRTRAKRRYDEIVGNGGHADLAEILADIERTRCARHRPHRFAAAPRSRCTLARYNRNGYRSRVRSCANPCGYRARTLN